MYNAVYPYLKDSSGAYRPNPAFGRFPVECPAQFVSLVWKCLAQRPAERPSFASVKQALDEMLVACTAQDGGVEA